MGGEKRWDSEAETRTEPRLRLTLRTAINASQPAFIAIGLFSFFINLLMLTGPIFMLQIYDRVLTSRSLPTLAVLFALVALLFLVMGLLEFIRSRVLVRIGVHVTGRIHERLFDAVMQLSLRSGGSEKAGTPLTDLNIIQQYLSGPGFVIRFDAPFVPAFSRLPHLFLSSSGAVSIRLHLLVCCSSTSSIRTALPSMEIATN